MRRRKTWGQNSGEGTTLGGFPVGNHETHSWASASLPSASRGVGSPPEGPHQAEAGTKIPPEGGVAGSVGRTGQRLSFPLGLFPEGLPPRDYKSTLPPGPRWNAPH